MAKKPTIEQIRRYVESESGSNAILLSSIYKNSTTNLSFRCQCGEIFSRRYDSFKQGNFKCTGCSGRKKWALESVKDFITVNGDGQCQLLSKTFTRVKDLLELQCQCGQVFKRSFQNIRDKNNFLCNSCLGKEIIDIEYAKKFMKDFTKNECEIISSNYNNCSTLLDLRCKCGRVFSRTFTKIKHYNQLYCPVCSIGRSKVEDCIAESLSNLSIYHKEEYSYADLKGINGGQLRYDFFVENKFLLEYDGENHFMIVNRSSSEEANRMNFQSRMSNDKIKNQHCIDNNIPLIRIPYWEFDNIESILTSALSYYNLLDSEEEYDKELFKEFLVDENWVHDDYIAKCPKNTKVKKRS